MQIKTKSTIQCRVVAALEIKPMTSTELSKMLNIGQQVANRACFNLGAKGIVFGELTGVGSTKIYSLQPAPKVESKFPRQSWYSPLEYRS